MQGARRIARISASGHEDQADLAALGLDIHRTRRIEPAQAVPQQGLEALLRGLRTVGQGAEHRALVRGEVLQVEHLRPLCRERLEHARLRAAGRAAHDAQRQRRYDALDLGDHQVAEGLVAALELAGVPAHHAQPSGEGATALAAAPAVDEGAPVLGLVLQRGEHVARDVGGHQRTAEAAGVEGRLLLVHRADDDALVVVEHRQVDRAGNVVFGELGGRARVDDLVKAGQLCYGRDAFLHDVDTTRGAHLRRASLSLPET